MSRSRPLSRHSGVVGRLCCRIEEMPMEPIAVVALATAAGMPLRALNLI